MGAVDQTAVSQGGFGYWPIDQPFPALLTDAQLRAVFGLSEATYHRWKKDGRFRRFLAPRQLSTRRTYYSGALVRDYCLGQWTEARTFGAQRGPRVGRLVSIHGRQSEGGRA